MPAAPVDEGELRQLLGWRLAQAAVITGAAFQAQVAGPLGLRPVEFSLLELLRASPGLSPAQLARALAISRPQATQVLDRLEAQALVRRQPSGSDGRGIEVHATPAGLRCVREALPRLVAAEQAKLRGLSVAERAMLMELLEKLARERR